MSHDIKIFTQITFACVAIENLKIAQDSPAAALEDMKGGGEPKVEEDDDGVERERERERRVDLSWQQIDGGGGRVVNFMVADDSFEEKMRKDNKGAAAGE